MAENCLPSFLSLLIAELFEPLHGRCNWRLTWLFLGALFAQGRQTVSRWLRAAGVSDEYQRYYYFLSRLGRKTNSVAGRLLAKAVERIDPAHRILLALDDSPTKRYGPKVEGAGLHHNPTPGPSDQKYVYGHIWVTLSLIVRHCQWGTVGLPILSKMYVRKKNLYRWWTRWRKISFQTKLEQAAELIVWAASWLVRFGKPIWVAVDGFYFKRTFLKAAREAGVVVVGRLRKDASLRSLPKKEPKRRGRKRKYGKGRIDLAKRAGHPRAWQKAEFVLYGKRVVKEYKTFLATYAPAFGTIRVVIVREENGWFAWACTKPDATVEEILEAVADRFAIEQDFHDLKEVHGAGKQQLRNYYSNVAAFNLLAWLHTLIELWAWDRSHEQLCDRSASPWDDPARRPSHADRRNALRRLCWNTQIQRCTALRPIDPEFQQLVITLIDYAVGL